MSHRFFSWIEGNHWRGNCLLSEQQIASLLSSYAWKYPVFASTQKYDSEGRILSCPLYIDIDGDSSEGHSALFIARQVVQAIQDRYNVIPDIFFSGRKGYHIIVPIQIEHPQCHNIVATMVAGLGCHGISNVDTRVYRNRAMLRICKSPASAEGYYKIRLTLSDLNDHDMDTHRQWAQQNSQVTPREFDEKTFNKTAWLEDIEAAKAQMSKRKQELSRQSTAPKGTRPWTPCLQGLLTKEPDEGQRHATAFILARYTVLAGIDEETALTRFLQFPHWKKFEEEEDGISRILRSLHKSGRTPTIGCRFDGEDRDLMKKHCDILCQYNTDWSLYA